MSLFRAAGGRIGNSSFVGTHDERGFATLGIGNGPPRGIGNGPGNRLGPFPVFLENGKSLENN